MTARELTASQLATALRVSGGRVTGILGGRHGITAETAQRLARYFGTSPQFWMNLQSRYELAVAQRDRGSKVRAEVEQAV
jgi:addiction module HigA family antidote